MGFPFLLLGGALAGTTAVVAAAPAGSESPRAAALARAMVEQGGKVVAGDELRAQLLAGARSVARSASLDAEALLVAAQRAYDNGNFEEVARRTEELRRQLAAEPPSERGEALLREGELFAGAALVLGGRSTEAAEYFRRALYSQPDLIADATRFAPPVRALLDQTRRQLAAKKRVRLQVDGAGERVLVDGLPRGVAPLPLDLPPHQLLVWLEQGGETSLAHTVQLREGAPSQLSVAMGFERLLRDQGAELTLAGEAQRQAVVQRIAFLTAAEDVVVLDRKADGTLVATRYGASGAPLAQVSVAQSLSGELTDWGAVARELTVSLRPGEAVVRREDRQHFPWLAVGAIGGGVVAAAAIGVAIGFATVHPGNVALSFPRDGSP